jgi:HK97 family phage major capsid protein
MASKYLTHLEQKFAAKKKERDDALAEMESAFEEKQEVDSELKTKFDELDTACVALKTEIEQHVKNSEELTRFEKGEQKTEFVPAVVTPRSIGEQLVNSDLYKNAVKGGKSVQGKVFEFEAKAFGSPAERKATFDTAAGGLDGTVNYQYGPVMVEQQRLTIRNLLPVGQTTLNSIPYIKETSFTNAADMVAEEGLKPEATFEMEDATAPVRKIAVIGRVTDELFADFPMFRDYVNQRLRFMVEQKEEQQLLNGAGTGQQITGILQTTGIQTQAKGTDTNADAIHKAITKIRSVGFFEPDGMVIHPTDWQLLRLAKDDNLQYYGGGPFTGAYGNGPFQMVERFWGLPVVITTAITAGTALVGAFRMGAQIWQREGITIATTDTDGEDWRYNRIAVRVEERLALTVYRPKAFCTVTSIA